MTTPRSCLAFTLIELLAVMSIMTLMAGICGLALQEGSPAIALQSAQGTVASLLAVARGQAAMNQNRAMLVVLADPANEHFLRSISIVVEAAPDSGRWWIAGEATLLPRGIYFVPGTAELPGAVFGGGDVPADGWPVTRRSSLEMVPEGSIPPPPEYPAGRYLGMVRPLTASGLAGGGGGDKLVLASARRTSTGVIFDQPERVGGIALSSYGVAILISDAAGFDF